MQPNLAMYNAFLYSAGMLKKPNLAFSILNDLQRDGLQPDVITLSALGSVCLNNHIQDRRALNLLISLESLPEATSNKKVRREPKIRKPEKPQRGEQAETKPLNSSVGRQRLLMRTKRGCRVQSNPNLCRFFFLSLTR